MDILKTPQQKLLEEAGFVPASPGMVNTPQQMLMQQSGIMPQFADGGSVQMSPQDMLAELIHGGRTPEHFSSGGSTLKNIGIQSGLTLPFLAEDAQLVAQSLKENKYPEAAARTAGVAYSAFAPFNPLTALLSGLTYAPETGDATLDAYLAKKQEMAAAQEAAKNKKPARQPERRNVIPFTETRFYKN